MKDPLVTKFRFKSRPKSPEAALKPHLASFTCGGAAAPCPQEGPGGGARCCLIHPVNCCLRCKSASSGQPSLVFRQPPGRLWPRSSGVSLSLEHPEGPALCYTLVLPGWKVAGF